MNELDNIISNLERQREAIDKALEALREVGGITSMASSPAATKKKPGKKKTGLTAEGRRRLAENMRKRWAAKRAATQVRKYTKRKSS